MIIKSISLRNIRSYLDETITFPDGSTLLAGEIGSGKSSILLAIEFALFGITRGVLSGSSLLRLGEQEGSIELEFSIEEKDYTIKRALKRVKDDVRQDAGYIIIDGQRQDCTPVELKSIVLELLGYPRQLLTKSKSLIYRYTVYTPQEQMKQILLEEGEARLDTLRKLFQIDRYQRIRENVLYVLRDIRQRQATLKGQTQDLADKEAQLAQLAKELSAAEKELSSLSPLLAEASSRLKDKQLQIKAKEARLKESGELKSALATSSAQAGEKLAQIQSILSELELIKVQVRTLQQQLSEMKEEQPEDESGLESQLESLESEKDALLRQKLTLEAEIKAQQKAIQEQESQLGDISSLRKCPLCLQDVSPEHISKIKEEQDGKIAQSRKLIDESAAKLAKIQERSAPLEQKLQTLKLSIKKSHKLRLALKERQNLSNLIKEKQERSSLLETRQKEQKKEFGLLNSQKVELEAKLRGFGALEQEYDSLRKELELIEKSEKALLIDSAKIKTRIDGLKSTRRQAEEELSEKKAAKEELISLTQKQNWLQVVFLNLMTTMEQHVMMRVYNEFNDIFQEYFSLLLEDAILSVTLDESFTPKIEQNGYEIYYEDLSGGEKTSIALAYRLALNRVINDLIDTIKTKDIIILDEPTDGFSTEQLDKMRAVLENLGTKQTIIVSHESKIESFVDNVLRISKNEHSSRISA